MERGPHMTKIIGLCAINKEVNCCDVSSVKRLTFLYAEKKIII